MANSTSRAAPVTLTQILEVTQGKWVNSDLLGKKSDQIQVEKAAPLGTSSPTCVAFFFSKEYQNEVVTARCGILITAAPFWAGIQAHGLPMAKTTAVVVCADPYLAMAKVSGLFGRHGLAKPGIHPSAVADPTAQVASSASIGAHVVISAGAVIGERSVILPGCFIGEGAIIGEDAHLFSNVSIYDGVVIGKRVRIHSNTTVGSDGFGYAPIFGAPGADGGKPKPVGHQKIHHLGTVVIGDDVELGACVTIDRATFGETRIGNQAKLDNQVHIGHNAVVEEGAIICGGTCLAGGAVVRKFAYVGGLVGITNRVVVGEGAMIGAQSLISKDVEPGATAVGNPQRDQRDHFKVHALLNKMLSDRKKGASGSGGSN
ncbi:MAG: UDP-3-O-(3-hydroxymyristoyl)glucosamine N-acyltransferase [Bdellovibrionales bacterium]|nr:UDP-3-O-(3-hydroxymyristoyl)glucosamine N-acyltransferase [Bdellovibrionales bacterium]